MRKRPDSSIFSLAEWHSAGVCNKARWVLSGTCLFKLALLDRRDDDRCITGRQASGAPLTIKKGVIMSFTKTLTEVVPDRLTRDEIDVLYEAATKVAEYELKKSVALTSPEKVLKLLNMKLIGYQKEVFGVILMDSQNRVKRVVDLFFGTINAAPVYPREVVKVALQFNAAAVIFYHNHPSGQATPSEADRYITERLKQSLDLVEVKIVDHFIFGKEKPFSFAEAGLL